MSGHPSPWVGNSTDPLDPLLYNTVAKLKNPERVPHANPVSFEKPQRVASHTKEYPTSKSERFLKE